MAREPFTITIGQARAYAEDTARVAGAVQALLKHDGWKTFIGLWTLRKFELRAKDDYASLEDFKADRRAIKLIEDLFGELETLTEDAETARSIFTKLTEAEDQTPETLVSTDLADEGRQG